MTCSEEESEVIKKSIQWWVSKRPKGWSYFDHLADPTVNTGTRVENNLACSIGEMLKEIENDE